MSSNTVDDTAAPAEPGCAASTTDPDGFFFLSNRATDGHYQIWEADHDGGNQRVLAGPAQLHIAWHDLDEVHNRLVIAGGTPGWKPNAFAPANVVNGPQQVVALIELDDPDAAPTVLIDARNGDHGFERIWHPTFSPDGSAVVFAAAAAGEQMNLWILDVAGGDLTRLVDEPGRSHNDPSWAPDGRVLFTRRAEPGDPNPFNLSAFDIWVMDPSEPLADPGDPPGSYAQVTDEAGLAAATADADLAEGPKGDTDPSMSPDCRSILNLRWESQEPLLIGRWSTVVHSASDTAAPSYASDVAEGHTTSVAHWETATQILVERTTWRMGGLLPTAHDAGIWRIDLMEPGGAELLVVNGGDTGHNSLPVSRGRRS